MHDKQEFIHSQKFASRIVSRKNSKDEFCYRATIFDRYKLRQGDMKISSKQLRIASWNVEGLSDVKIEILQRIMRIRDIDIICLQETHRSLSDVVVTDAGFLLVLSGGSVET